MITYMKWYIVYIIIINELRKKIQKKGGEERKHS
jgi:hypothetical protein